MDVVSGGTSHLVGVTTGLYCDTLVQVYAARPGRRDAGGGAVIVTQAISVPADERPAAAPARFWS